MKTSLLACVILFFPIMFFVSCKKADTKTTEFFYFRGKINGVNIDWKSSYSSSYQTTNFRTAISDPGGSMPLNGSCLPNDSNYQFYLGTTIFEIHDNSGTDFRNNISVDFTRAGSSAYKDVLCPML
ncbi:MAG: hypothetical protein KA319_06540 [Ferruginibacter sp.]|nr:hypothetical protein [Ferruginibacter sp.]